jgi:imidazolonepropionase-like amidohydrolase
MRFLSAVAGSALLAVSGPALAQDLMIVHGRLHTEGPAGVIEDGAILVRGGRIQAVGVKLQPPSDIRIIDAKGRPVTPGLFDPASMVGLAESQEGEANDLVGVGEGAEVADAIDFNSPGVAVTRAQGVTRAAATPAAGKGMVGGVSALIALTGQAGMVFVRAASSNLQIGEAEATASGGSRAGVLARLETALKAPSVAEAVAKRRLIVVAADRESDIRLLAAFASSHGLNVVILGGAEAWRAADVLAKAGVGVILRPTENLPNRWETMGADFSGAARLAAAGVLFSFAQADWDTAPPLSQLAGIAVAHGLPWDKGLASITIEPARMFGVADRLGSLEPGRLADIVIWDGDPLEVTSAPTTVVIDGVPRSLRTRQTDLRDAYLK